MFRLAEQCIERAKSFTGRSQQSHDLSSPSPLPPPPSILPHQTETPKALGASYPNSTEETPGDEIKMFFQFWCVIYMNMWWNKMCQSLTVGKYPSILWQDDNMKIIQVIWVIKKCPLNDKIVTLSFPTDTQYDPLIDVSPKATSPSNSPHHRELLEGAEEPPPFVPPEVFQRLQTAESQDTSRK